TRGKLAVLGDRRRSRTWFRIMAKAWMEACSSRHVRGGSGSRSVADAAVGRSEKRSRASSPVNTPMQLRTKIAKMPTTTRPFRLRRFFGLGCSARAFGFTGAPHDGHVAASVLTLFPHS